MLRNTMTSERPLSDTLPHPQSSSFVSLGEFVKEKRTNEREWIGKEKERGGGGKKWARKKGNAQTNVRSPLQPLFLLYMYICSLSFARLLSLSLSPSPPSLYVCVSLFFHSLSRSLCIFRRQNVGLSDGWIYFRTRLSTSPTRDLCESRGPLRTFKRVGDYSYPAVARWGINDGGRVRFSVKRRGTREKKIYPLSCPFQFSFLHLDSL